MQQNKKETPDQRRKREERNANARTANAALRALDGWETVAQYESESSGSIHTVTFNGTACECTCQDFRIRRKPKGDVCKHIRQWQFDRDPGIYRAHG